MPCTICKNGNGKMSWSESCGHPFYEYIFILNKNYINELACNIELSDNVQFVEFKIQKF